MTTPVKLAIAGGGGRMGQTLIKAVMADKRFVLVAISEHSKQSLEQLFIANRGKITLTTDAEELAAKAHAVIDFTAPESTLDVAKAVAKRGGIHIVGTTGFSVPERKKLESYAAKARMVQSGNFSLGVNLLETLVAQAAKILDDAYDIEISETHHKYKKDAPSGTALMLGKAAAKARKVDFDQKKILDRNGERKRGDIGFLSARGGDVVGIHSVLFAGPGEVIELKHEAFSRDIYASGALHAALWAQNQPAGLYSMQDVLSSALKNK
jgi:4-hydroxy-tetrahydrodipicolinate reductase